MGHINVKTGTSRSGNKSAGDIMGIGSPITIERVRRGFPTKSIVSLGHHLDITQRQMLDLLNMSRQTYAKRKATGSLTVEESDHVLRYAQLLALAIDLFEDEEAAARWLNTPAIALSNETPLAQATTEFGARNVERLIGRLELGVPT